MQNDVAAHVEKVANTSVRNSGTLAGNLMMKKAHPSFPSDIFVLLAAVGAKLMIRAAGSESTSSSEAEQWLKEEDMTGKIIVSISFPPIDAATHVFR